MPTNPWWDRDRPPGDWTELGGSFPPTALTRPCHVCQAPAGEFCFVRREVTGMPPNHLNTFPSVHTDRWSAYKARAENPSRTQLTLDL